MSTSITASGRAEPSAANCSRSRPQLAARWADLTAPHDDPLPFAGAEVLAVHPSILCLRQTGAILGIALTRL
jgi:hypothetical protein